MPPIEQNLSTAPSGDRATIVCIYCERPQEVSLRAQSITCKFCYKPLKLKDETFTRYEARRAVETIGIVTVEKKGNVIADRVICGGLVVRGKLKGTVKSRGAVLVGPEAEIKGDVTAPSLAVGAGAILEGRYAIGNKKPEGARDVEEKPPLEPD